MSFQNRLLKFKEYPFRGGGMTSLSKTGIITVRKLSCGKVMFYACHSVHGEEVYTPLGRHPPPPRRPLQRMVRILLECILVHTGVDYNNSFYVMI